MFDQLESCEALVIGLSGLVEGRVLGCYHSNECFGCEDGRGLGDIYRLAEGGYEAFIALMVGEIGLAHLML